MRGNSELRMFSRWVKKSINNRFVFKRYDDYCAITDGYVAYKIPYQLKDYIAEIKKQTFQDLTEDFVISYREIEYETSPCDLKEFFKYEKECIETGLFYGNTKKMKIFMLGKELVFVNEAYINITTSLYKCYGTSPISAVVFENDELCFAVMPVRMCGFKYQISSALEGDLDVIHS
jgi:hypothetical protein